MYVHSDSEHQCKRENQVGPHRKWRHQEGGTRKTRWNFPGKQKTICGLATAWGERTQPHLCEIAATKSFWEKEQRSTEKEMEGQHKRRHEEIPTYWRHGTRSKILDDWNNGRPCTSRCQERWKKHQCGGFYALQNLIIIIIIIPLVQRTISMENRLQVSGPLNCINGRESLSLWSIELYKWKRAIESLVHWTV